MPNLRLVLATTLSITVCLAVESGDQHASLRSHASPASEGQAGLLPFLPLLAIVGGVLVLPVLLLLCAKRTSSHTITDGSGAAGRSILVPVSYADPEPSTKQKQQQRSERRYSDSFEHTVNIDPPPRKETEQSSNPNMPSKVLSAESIAEESLYENTTGNNQENEYSNVDSLFAEASITQSRSQIVTPSESLHNSKCSSASQLSQPSKMLLPSPFVQSNHPQLQSKSASPMVRPKLYKQSSHSGFPNEPVRVLPKHSSEPQKQEKTAKGVQVMLIASNEEETTSDDMVKSPTKVPLLPKNELSSTTAPMAATQVTVLLADLLSNRGETGREATNKPTVAKKPVLPTSTPSHSPTRKTECPDLVAPPSSKPRKGQVTHGLQPVAPKRNGPALPFYSLDRAELKARKSKTELQATQSRSKRQSRDDTMLPNGLVSADTSSKHQLASRHIPQSSADQSYYNCDNFVRDEPIEPSDLEWQDYYNVFDDIDPTCAYPYMNTKDFNQFLKSSGNKPKLTDPYGNSISSRSPKKPSTKGGSLPYMNSSVIDEELSAVQADFLARPNNPGSKQSETKCQPSVQPSPRTTYPSTDTRHRPELAPRRPKHTASPGQNCSESIEHKLALRQHDFAVYTYVESEDLPNFDDIKQVMLQSPSGKYLSVVRSLNASSMDEDQYSTEHIHTLLNEPIYEELMLGEQLPVAADNCPSVEIYEDVPNEYEDPVQIRHQTIEEEDDTYDLVTYPSDNAVQKKDNLYSALQSVKSLTQHDYTIREPIGEGRYSVVSTGVWWNAPGGRQAVAVKQLKSNSKNSSEVVTNLLQEAAILDQLRHNNVVKLVGIDTSFEELPTIFMELLPSGDLKKHLRHCREQIKSEQPSFCDELGRRFVNFATDVASGMNYLANKHLIHRDLAARNVFLDSHLVCKIGDFGMSRELAAKGYYAHKRTALFPLKWTAPEVLAYRKYTLASDVWSYGCLLYEIWSLGREPLSTIPVAEIFPKILAGYRDAPPPGCPRGIYRLMVSCWNPNRQKRKAFSAIRQMLVEKKVDLLQLAKEEDGINRSKYRLGAALSEGINVFSDLQSVYRISAIKLEW